MKHYEVTLQSPVATSFRCTRAANALDIDQKKKSIHHFAVDADLDAPFSVGLIVDASGSGKTTLARQIYGDDCFRELLDLTRPVIDQFPEAMAYDDCAKALSGVGLTQVPCWIRPAVTLSNGQRVRAECALQMAASRQDRPTVIDEWTSVVDRTVAKVMSHCIAKHARKTGRQVVLASCHYDVIEWLDPDWIIDCNKQEFIDRRLLPESERRRKERLRFEIRPAHRDTWRFFSRYHYLSDRLPGGKIETFGLFIDGEQIAFQCFANYVPFRPGHTHMQMHSNRTVIHPDYAGLGLDIVLINDTSAIMAQRGFDVRAKFASLPVFKAMSRQPCWIPDETARKHAVQKGGTMQRYTGFRIDVTTHSFRFDLGRWKAMRGKAA